MLAVNLHLLELPGSSSPEHSNTTSIINTNVYSRLEEAELIAVQLF